MKNIGACINCREEFVYLLANGLCPTCQDGYEKRRANYKKPVVVLEGRRKLTFSGSYALPERIKLYKTIHKHVSEGALKTREYEKATIAIGLTTIIPIQRGYNLWLESGGSHE